jgi:hypothetical protein
VKNISSQNIAYKRVISIFLNPSDLPARISA